MAKPVNTNSNRRQFLSFFVPACAAMSAVGIIRPAHAGETEPDNFNIFDNPYEKELSVTGYFKVRYGEFIGLTIDEENPEYDVEETLSHPYGNKEKYSENFSITNCHLQPRSSGIRIGYGLYPIRRGTFSNIQILGSNRGIGIFAHDRKI